MWSVAICSSPKVQAILSELSKIQSLLQVHLDSSVFIRQVGRNQCCMCVCVCACMRACVCACVHVCVRACVCMCVHT